MLRHYREHPIKREPGMRVVRAMSTRGDSGASAVEFALVSLILFPLLFGILQYGYYFFALQNGNSVAREAARKVSVGDCSSNTALETVFW